MSKKLLLIGGGGHCKTVIEAVESRNDYEDIGIIDVSENVGKQILDCKIIGTDRELKHFFYEGFKDAFISLGSIGNPNKRISLYKQIKSLGFYLPVISHFSANISQYASVSEGSFAGKNVIINADTTIGKCVILNTGCIIEHDCGIADFAHIAPGSIISGNVTIGEKTHIGAGSVIRQNTIIGDQTIIGMGSVVVNNVEENCVAFGNPCRKVDNN
ncbi:acetyltransferase [Acetobacterium sp. KB-1]|jgi:sugar O-acyltransferase (sialic acid O-acetyltransferase NeuD family)|uniref:acetyltransferase n=1 Tax=Acetobacterium sp. KB-1 TaxID=2184575 RepID=UPI000DBEBF9C|nr:acetyltransferase [Acetobacterium sp. KB-1]AWW26394.1 serine acetyltransferase [Acetobacterium sp. KB-1]